MFVKFESKIYLENVMSQLVYCEKIKENLHNFKA